MKLSHLSFYFLVVVLSTAVLATGCKSKKKAAAKSPAISKNSGTTPSNPEEVQNLNPNAYKPETGGITSGNRNLSQEEIQKRLGDLMDALAKDLKQFVKDVEVVREGDGVRVTFDPGVYFSFDSADLTPKAKENIASLAEVLSKYGYTNMFVQGHTDTWGKKDYNYKLSQKRADIFADYAKAKGVDNGRITAKGFGPDKPRYSNNTLDGRQKNRRIDAVITATTEMMRKIANGEL
ncbi:MAG: OmpA family protein [Spirosomataceae bacterium]